MAVKCVEVVAQPASGSRRRQRGVVQAVPKQEQSIDQSEPQKKQKTVLAPSTIPPVPQEHKEYTHAPGMNATAIKQNSSHFCPHRKNMQPLAHVEERALVL